MNHRHIFLLILLCSSLLLVQAQQTSVILRCAPAVIAASPLYVVDGAVVELDQLTGLDPSEISSIDILKGTESSALFGCRGAYGCVFITTKSAGRRIIQLYDLISGKTVAKANLSVSNKQTSSPVAVTADSFYYRIENIQPGKDYCLRANAPGYQAFTGFINLTQRDTLRIGLTPNPEAGIAERKKSESHPMQFSIFPNPIRRDEVANVRLITDQPILLRVYDMQGRVVMQQLAANNGTTQLAGLSGGVYNVQIVSAKGITLDVKKLCIQ